MWWRDSGCDHSFASLTRDDSNVSNRGNNTPLYTRDDYKNVNLHSWWIFFLWLQAAYVYTPEVYPTFLRSVGVGSCSGMARLGATLTPYIAQVLMKKSVHLAVAVYVAVALIAAFACVMLPFETKGHDLSDNNRGKSNLKSWSKVPKSHHNSLLPFIFHSFTVIFYKYFFFWIPSEFTKINYWSLTKSKSSGISSQMIGFLWSQLTSCHLIPSA